MARCYYCLARFLAIKQLGHTRGSARAAPGSRCPAWQRPARTSCGSRPPPHHHPRARPCCTGSCTLAGRTSACQGRVSRHTHRMLPVTDRHVGRFVRTSVDSFARRSIRSHVGRFVRTSVDSFARRSIRSHVGGGGGGRPSPGGRPRCRR
eukprot:1185469-Prorocentrum_minimum.AAC.5